MNTIENDNSTFNPDSAVGYGKPPKEKQFKPGRSGNPSGRPKNAKAFKPLTRLVRDCLMEQVTATIKGKKRKMLLIEAVIAKQMSNAMQGSLQSAKFLLGLADKHVPTHLSLEELMGDRPVLGFTSEEAGRFTKERLMAGMEDLARQPIL